MVLVFIIFFQIKIVFFFLTIVFVLANSADTDKMRLYVAFYLGFRCLSKYTFRDFQSPNLDLNVYIYDG